ncbi:hypothetical protein BKA69DRAFT_1124226 [Paraphysoderma sedebokerense]|nr:hypothetical protein BKA69DRAFT_1124226 [Paraphysoderma sedebokerense]
MLSLPLCLHTALLLMYFLVKFLLLIVLTSPLVSPDNGFERPKIRLKRLESGIKISKYLSETKTTKTHFESGDKIEFRFQTASNVASLIDPIIAVNLFQEANNKYNYIGNLVILHAIQSEVEYSMEIILPTFLESGSYIIASSLLQPNYRAELPLDVTQVKLALRSANVMSKSNGRGRHISNPDTAQQHTVETHLSNPVVLREILNSLSSVSEVCNICTTSKSIISSCDDILRIRYPVQSVPMLTAPMKNGRPITTEVLCNIAALERKVQKVGFKYLDRVVLKTLTLGNPIVGLKADATENGQRPEFTLWAHPLLEKYYNRYLQIAVSSIAMTFFAFYDGITPRDMIVSTRDMVKLVPWRYLENTVGNFLKMMATAKYIESFSSNIKVEIAGDRVILNWFPYMAGLVIKKSDLPTDVLSILERWGEATVDERVAVMQRIGGW